ncbi:inositol monophosphatase family protein [Aestuariivirga litoralis]|uniref:inositol monophosphatase family protein n=1 Tax=Aestuariivirga litoralis TaxID=2650924 RepID=UPI0018C6FFE1|nr:inositol monophosphatase [Aestuariivirga litoralis]MBG1230751.1 inositol monophosphatase [Aestuariivirga litoralis]
MTNQSEFSERFEFAKMLIREAGEIAHTYFKNRDSLTVKSKGLQDMASEADLNTEIHIKKQIADAFPADAFLGEETGITNFSEDQGIWVVDPIDGTQPFISGMSSWCVSIAFVKGNDLKFGMVFAPVRNELFAGGPDFPSTLNGAPMQKHPAKTLQQGIVGVGYSPRVVPAEFLPMFGRLLDAGGMFYREGSGALTLSYVAAGRLIGYIEPHINSWDCLGAIAVIRGAGLRTSDFLANEGLNKGNRVIAGNDDTYPALVSIYEGNS